jgi:hypothetical protein
MSINAELGTNAGREAMKRPGADQDPWFAFGSENGALADA